MDVSGKPVTVVGLGESGLAATRLLCERGAQVTVNDTRSEAQLGERGQRAKALGARLLTGRHDAAQLATQALVVVSPGVPPLAELDAAEAAGVPVVSEIELAYRLLRAPTVAISGTNGKSTVTTLVGEMVRHAGRPCFVGGNLGMPVSDAVGAEGDDPSGLVVAELSSFQLERVVEFRAHVAMLLNATDDHLDRYPDFAAYVAAKARIFERQQTSDYACAPAHDPLCLSLAASSGGTLRTFGPGGDVRVDGDALLDTLRGDRFPLSQVRIRGEHNRLNACAAVLVASVLGVPVASIAAALAAFPGLPHRTQWVTDHDGVSFYDDSKATNVGAAVAAVRGLASARGKLVLVAGGKDKGGAYAPLVAALLDTARAVVVLGDAAPLIEAAVKAESPLTVMRARDMDDAVQLAMQLAEPGDSVLLAPACSSFDMFDSYVHRGQVFQAAVRERTGEGT